METFSALLALFVFNSPVPGEFLSQTAVTWSIEVFLDLHLNIWMSKYQDTNDLRCHCAHYDITAMHWVISLPIVTKWSHSGRSNRSMWQEVEAGRKRNYLLGSSFNIRTIFFGCKDSHHKDKTVSYVLRLIPGLSLLRLKFLRKKITNK